MVVIRILLQIVSVPVAALAGNWLGGHVRATLTGQPVQSVRFRHTTADGRTIINIPVVTKFYPALVAGALGKPRWLYAFLGGVATGGLLDDRLETLVWDRVERIVLSSRDTTGKPTGVVTETA